MTRARAWAALAGITWLVTCSTVPAVAQWTVGAGIRAPRFFGGAVEPATGRWLRPYRPTMWDIGVDRSGPRMGIGLRARFASSSLALEGTDALAAVKDALTVYGLDPEVSLRVGRLGAEGVVRLFAGPVFEVWDLPDAGSRLRVGASVSLALEVPFGGRWAGSARIGAAVTPSPFAREDLNESFEPRTLWRREAGAGLRYRL
jgi:hypothetical protein